MPCPLRALPTWGLREHHDCEFVLRKYSCGTYVDSKLPAATRRLVLNRCLGILGTRGTRRPSQGLAGVIRLACRLFVDYAQVVFPSRLTEAHPYFLRPIKLVLLRLSPLLQPCQEPLLSFLNVKTPIAWSHVHQIPSLALSSRLKRHVRPYRGRKS